MNGSNKHTYGYCKPNQSFPALLSPPWHIVTSDSKSSIVFLTFFSLIWSVLFFKASARMLISSWLELSVAISIGVASVFCQTQTEPGLTLTTRSRNYNNIEITHAGEGCGHVPLCSSKHSSGDKSSHTDMYVKHLKQRNRWKPRELHATRELFGSNLFAIFCFEMYQHTTGQTGHWPD